MSRSTCASRSTVVSVAGGNGDDGGVHAVCSSSAPLVSCSERRSALESACAVSVAGARAGPIGSDGGPLGGSWAGSGSGSWSQRRRSSSSSSVGLSIPNSSRRTNSNRVSGVVPAAGALRSITASSFGGTWSMALGPGWRGLTAGWRGNRNVMRSGSPLSSGSARTMLLCSSAERAAWFRSSQSSDSVDASTPGCTEPTPAASRYSRYARSATTGPSTSTILTRFVTNSPAGRSLDD